MQVCEVAPSAGPQQKSKIETGPSKAGECLTCLQMTRQKAEEAEQVHWVQCQFQEPADLDCFFFFYDLEQDRLGFRGMDSHSLDPQPISQLH